MVLGKQLRILSKFENACLEKNGKLKFYIILSESIRKFNIMFANKKLFYIFSTFLKWVRPAVIVKGLTECLELDNGWLNGIYIQIIYLSKMRVKFIEMGPKFYESKEIL